MNENPSLANALKALIHSRKFLVLSLDTVVSIVLYFGSKYVGESAFADVKFLIGALQAPALMLIYAISKEDSAASLAGAWALVQLRANNALDEDAERVVLNA